MAEDFLSTIQKTPLLIGIVVGFIIMWGIPPVGYATFIDPIIISAVACYFLKGTRKDALVHGIILGIFDIIILYIIFAGIYSFTTLNLGLSALLFFVILSAFGGFLGKVLQEKT